MSDVIIVGGGPSGLAAALELARRGASVVVIDESHSLGGQYYRRRVGGVRDEYGEYRADGTRLIDRVYRAGVRCYTDRAVWGIDGGDTHALLTSRISGAADPMTFSGKVVIIATGAYEWGVPFPGWELPGVVTPGYVLHLATCDRVPLGRSIVVAGTGPFLLVAATAVLGSGGGVAAVVDVNRPYRMSRDAAAASTHLARMAELAKYMTILWRHRVPILQGWRVTAAQGDDGVESVTLEQTGGEARSSRTMSVDGLAVGYGFRPAVELLQLMGAEGHEDGLGDFLPTVDESGRTSVAGVYAIGEAAGVAGVQGARARGVLAGDAIATSLGLGGRASPRRHRAARDRTRSMRFAEITRKLFPAGRDLFSGVPGSAVVCRCEGVTAEAIRRACTPDWGGTSFVKAITRAGMGPCQGRQCAPAVAAIVSEATGRPASSQPVRMPVKPVGWSGAVGDPGD
ncbi:MAG: FAD-dependent oxidoreductase [Candidatus Dormibacteria bacterium]